MCQAVVYAQTEGQEKQRHRLLSHSVLLSVKCTTGASCSGGRVRILRHVNCTQKSNWILSLYKTILKHSISLPSNQNNVQKCLQTHYV